MATVVLPRSLVALFPGLPRRQDVPVGSVASVIDVLDAAAPGLRDRLVEPGPRLRAHINVYVGGSPAELATPVADGDTVHVIPAVSGGAGR
jgi:molybdopterin converting factor small subunit